ncbi:MAG: Crp/Fnr family transcriptional regulator [Candidatus Marinimicrobia bacterium]|nr:Crp/Fnr family transcriptional regulator [Candidatus Neomarinimicrobiota bacterium]MCH7859459.1 Crp/Fnr family transcriptional regulator [Candidatus Neomarinimicrobiota bacterium]
MVSPPGVSILREVPIFTELDDESLDVIMGMTVRRTFTKNTMIVIEEAQADTLYIIESGSVKITRLNEDGREVILALLGPSEFFGEMALLDGQGRSANVMALEDTVLFNLIRRDFLDVLSRFPSISIQLLREMTLRLRKSDEQIKSLSLSDAEHRIGITLHRIAEDMGTFKMGEVVIRKLPYQQDIANMAGTSRETVSRMLKHLEARGLMERDGRRLTIHDYASFSRIFG